MTGRRHAGHKRVGFTRPDRDHVVKKPIMSTKDLRFFEIPDAQSLPDGHPRQGMSVVAALSDWLVHTNRRRNGAWTRRYEHGIPVTGLVRVADDGTTGTSVCFRACVAVLGTAALSTAELARSVASWRHLSVETR